MKNLLFFLLFLIFIAAPLAVSAQEELVSNSDAPLEITADGSLEWKRKARQFIAQKNALAQQGDVSVAAQTLIADYRDSDTSSMEIWQVTADNDVVIRSKDSAAFGQNAVYNLDSGLAVMTGENLRMTSPDQTVTASESFEYQVEAGRLTATGNARVQRYRDGNKNVYDTLVADTVSAVLKDNAQGKRVLDTLEATGNVVITTASETVTGAYGIYKADTNTAELTGGVTIKRGPNTLKGQRATVNLNTETSQLFGGSGPTGRVRGVFYPGSEKKLEE